ncbi:hypothetical protein B7R22_00845 [Subtercola boreus]|uniref:Uncharacterized protein n=1 Tax=Subtercola boreus TaxID=120213 RepID=A0A3E0W548_9MICO|nr:hypothetical protein B7R22_00845 [Subtercola boreus]
MGWGRRFNDSWGLAAEHRRASLRRALHRNRADFTAGYSQRLFPSSRVTLPSGKGSPARGAGAGISVWATQMRSAWCAPGWKISSAMPIMPAVGVRLRCSRSERTIHGIPTRATAIAPTMAAHTRAMDTVSDTLHCGYGLMESPLVHSGFED